MNWADRIAEARESLGLSLGEFGDLVGVSKETIRKWEFVEREPRADIALEVCTRLGVSVDDALGSGPMSVEPDTNASPPRLVWSQNLAELSAACGGDRALARALSVPHATIGWWIRRQADPSLAWAARVARRCGVSVAEILTEEVDSETVVARWNETA